MDPSFSSSSVSFATLELSGHGDTKEKLDGVDPFLVEALQNPRHRLTILRMEWDIQRFMESSDQHQFEFQYLPTSYLRCAAHRVAQHYGLLTVVSSDSVDGLGGKIVAKKTPECRYPAVLLSDIPSKHSENERNENVKIAIRRRLSQASSNSANKPGFGGPLRSVEERKEEYDKARARIFSGSSTPEVELPSSTPTERRNLFSGSDEQVIYRPVIKEIEKTSIKDGTSRVAIFRDREKDRTDPDYDRSYERYVKGIVSCQNFNLAVHDGPQPPCLQYEGDFSHLGQLPTSQVSLSYRPSTQSLSPFCVPGHNQVTGGSVYMPWPTPAMIYAQSYDQFRRAIYLAPMYQQPLSFEYSQNQTASR